MKTAHLYFKTIIPEYLKNSKIKSGRGIKIYYTVFVPKSIYLKVGNSFGKTNIKNIGNEVNIKNIFCKTI